MDVSEINHALVALDSLRELIKAGDVVAWAFCTVPTEAQFGAQGFVANGRATDLYTAICILKRRFEDEVLASVKPKA